MTLPAVVAVVGLCVGAIGLAGQQLRLSSAVADAVRFEARGDASPNLSQRLGYHVRVSSEETGDLVCVRATAHPASAILAAIEIQARACTLRNDL